MCLKYSNRLFAVQYGFGISMMGNWLWWCVFLYETFMLTRSLHWLGLAVLISSCHVCSLRSHYICQSDFLPPRSSSHPIILWCGRVEMHGSRSPQPARTGNGLFFANAMGMKKSHMQYIVSACQSSNRACLQREKVRTKGQTWRTNPRGWLYCVMLELKPL